jgi:predicted phosphodiesterase
MRIALMSDVHGNLIALDSVLDDIESSGGVDGYWVLGDIVALGYGPVQVLERLTRLPNTRFARGNTDRYLFTGDRPKPSPEDAVGSPELVRTLAGLSGAIAWTQGAIASAGWFDWLSALPFELRTTLPDGARLLGVHASPQADDLGVHRGLSESEIRELLAGCDADLVCAGHTHVSMEARVDQTHVVNLGSISNPFAPDLRASYAILEADASGYEIQVRKVEYDRDAVIAALQAVKYPFADMFIQHLRGEKTPPW